LQKAEGALNSAITHIKEQVREVLAAAATGTLIPKSTPAGLPKKEIITRTAHSDSGQNTIPSPDADRLGMAPEREMTGAAEEGLFPLPPDWKWVNVAEAGEVTIGRKREPKYHDGPNMRPYLRVANVLEDRIDTTDLLRMNFSPEEYETYSLRNGDILLNEGQSPELVGRPAMYRGEVAGACFQMTLLRFRASPAVDPQFALLVFRHYLHSGEFRKIARWTTNIAHLTLKRFSAMPFPLPPKSTQLDIAREAQRRLDETSMQLSAATASLERLPGIEAQLYAAAANGQILPQDDRDEPASELLSRLGPPYPEPTRNRRHIRSSRPKAPDRTTPVQEAATGPYTDTLSSVLSVAGVSMPLPELFRRARYDRDSTQDIEEFYLILREELGSTVRISGDAGENASVEAVPDENR
jgi:type I restriction enzyme S subunit